MIRGAERRVAALSSLDAAAACGNVKVIDEVLTRDEMHALMQACDCYVSLHRCEGYGLTLAEAMAYGKPVVGTIYSSVADFMNSENSRPIWPCMKVIGTNTATSTMVVASTAKPTWRVPR